MDWAYPAAFITGASLSVSGAALQSVLRNPLAEPYLLGTVGGAALFTTAAVVTGLTAAAAWVMPLASFAGSCLSLALVFSVAYFARRARLLDGGDAFVRSAGSSVVLAGFVTGSFTGSLQMLVVSYAEPEAFTMISKWLFGSLASATAASTALSAVVFAAVFTVLLSMARRLNVMELGTDEAECLGIDVRRTLLVVIAAVAMATAASVANSGAIGFVGLVVPHVVRRKMGPLMQKVLPASAILGGIVLAAAEGVSRLFPGDVSVGVVAAVFGAPFFFRLLASRRNGEGWDI